MHSGERSPIKHVFYIIKENRTYDQVFGDLPQGNGDPTLVAVRTRRHAESPRAGRAVRAARQLLRSRRSVRARASLGPAGVSEHVGAQVRQRAQQPEPDAARPDRRHLRQREGAWTDGAGVRRARRQHDHAGQRDLDRHLQRLEERHQQRQHRRAGDHRRPARRLSSEVSGRRGPRARSIPGGHLPQGVRGVREEREPAQPVVLLLLRRSHGGDEPRIPDSARDGCGQRPGARPDRRGDLARAATGRSLRSS